MDGDLIQRELVFQQSSLDGLDRLATLYHACFDVVPPVNYFSWKYRDNPSGSLVGFEATHQGAVVASYAVIPEAYVVDGRPRVVWQSMDTMTHPDYQRRGLFVTLARMTFDHLASVDPEFLIIGIPAPASHAGFTKKLGWSDVHQFRLMFQERRAFMAVTSIRRSPQLSFRTITGSATSLTEYLRLRPPPSRHIQNEISAEFLTWRVLDNPMRKLELVEFSHSGEPCGIAAFTNDDSGKSFILLLDVADPQQLPRLTPPVLKHVFQRTGARVVSTWEPLDKQLRNAYVRSGLMINPTQRGPMTFRQPLITYSAKKSFEGFDPTSPSSFSLQPVMQD